MIWEQILPFLGYVALVIAVLILTRGAEKPDAPKWLEREWLKRWLAREWLFFAGGLGGGLVLTILLARFRILFFVWWWLPYFLLQAARLTVWAVRTVRR